MLDLWAHVLVISDPLTLMASCTNYTTICSSPDESLPSKAWAQMLFLRFAKVVAKVVWERADSRSKKSYTSAACGRKTTFTERYTK